MELRDWATRILSADTLEEKLFTPDHLTDHAPGAPVFWDTPTRPAGMQFSKHGKEDKLPTFKDHYDPNSRARCLHRFGGHELLAVEIMAYALLAFPDTPTYFRKGVANTLREEQQHVRLYMAEMQRLNVTFGDLPLYKHFWKQVPYLKSPIQYISVMALTFEMANLDFAPLYRDSFRRHGDESCAQLMEQIIRDEISHVSFGMHCFNRLKPHSEQSDFNLYKEALPPILSPKRAKGFVFQSDLRKKAHIPDEWISSLKDFH
ncbi:MAG: ferritin-like domain-containing protein [Simkaniaceae bacterium]|nr:ferritin-like domain-containing protein [Simkaniaceae bacterium]